MKIESTYQKGTKVILKINQKEVKLNENISG